MVCGERGPSGAQNLLGKRVKGKKQVGEGVREKG